jgi:hypothetical protein
MVIMLTSNNDTNEPQEDSKFRENLRAQLQDQEVRSSRRIEMADRRRRAEERAEGFDEAMQMPFVVPALRWIGGIFGTVIFTFGLFWFLSFFGIVIPWYGGFALLIMIAGGAFMVGAATSGKRRRMALDRCDN